jgi:hypothetical protein
MTFLRRFGAGWRARAALAGVAALLGGCASSTMEDAAPTAVAPALSETAMTGGARDTGTYPNLANQQITPEDKAERIAELNAAQQRQGARGSGGGATENPVILKKLADTHGDETLKAIEGN